MKELLSLIKPILIAIMLLGVSSCEKDDDPQPSSSSTYIQTSSVCTRTVTSFYLEPYSGYNGGYLVGYNQYTVLTVDTYGNYLTFYDATNIPYVGKCW